MTKNTLYLLSIEVSANAANIAVDEQGLPSVMLDSTFVDQKIGLFADGFDPLSTSQEASTNPGASATFSKFIFQPLP